MGRCLKEQQATGPYITVD